jgi:hypothetical protein
MKYVVCHNGPRRAARERERPSQGKSTLPGRNLCSNFVFIIPQFLFVCQFWGKSHVLIIQWPAILSTLQERQSAYKRHHQYIASRPHSFSKTASENVLYAPSFLSGRALRPPFRLFMRLRKPPPLEGLSPSLLVGRGALSAVTLLVRPLPCPFGTALLADKLRVAEGRSCSAIRI